MSTFKVGDRVVCVKERNGITEGRIYTVTRVIDDSCLGEVVQVDGKHPEGAVGFYVRRFELVTPTNSYTVHDESFSSAVVGWPFFTINEATVWIQENGIPGHTYTVRESIERRKFEVVEKVQRELKAL